MTLPWYAFCFSSLPGVGPKTFHRVRKRLAEKGCTWEDLFDGSGGIMSTADIIDVLGPAFAGIEIPPLEPEFCSEAEANIRNMTESGFHVLVSGEDRYPAILLETLADSAAPEP